MLVLRSLLWTILLPGVVAGYIPWRFLGVSHVHIDLADLLDFLGLLLIAAGAALLIACIWEFAARGRGTLSPVDPPRLLVVRGLYRFVRNPMYLSVSTIVLGEALLARSPALLLYWAFFFAAVNLFVRLYEEPALRRQFGESYERSTKQVGRWLPHSGILDGRAAGGSHISAVAGPREEAALTMRYRVLLAIAVLVAIDCLSRAAAQTTACTFDTAAHLRDDVITIGLAPGWDSSTSKRAPDDYLAAAYAIQARFRPPAQLRIPLAWRTKEKTSTPDRSESIGYGLDGSIQFWLTDSGRVTKEMITAGGPWADIVNRVLEAIKRVDSAGEFTPPGSDVLRKEGAIQVRLVDAAHTDAPAVELFRARIPVLVVDSNPAVLSIPRLQYPDDLRQAGITGRVLVEFVIDEAGRPDTSSIAVLESEYREFTAAAVSSVKAGRFRPGRVAGCPVAVLARLPIDFKIRR